MSNRRIMSYIKFAKKMNIKPRTIKKHVMIALARKHGVKISDIRRAVRHNQNNQL